MFKKIATASLLTLSLMSAAQAADGLKIGVVQSQVILSKAPQIEVIEQRLKGEFSDRQDQLIKIEEQANALIQKFKANEMTMSSDEKTEIRRKIDALSDEHKRKGREFQEDLKRRRQEELMALQKKVLDTIAQISKKQGFDMVLSNDSVLFINDRADITDLVVKELSKSTAK